MRISSVWAIFFVSFIVSLCIYLPTTDAKLVFDFIDFIRSYFETGWNIYYTETHHISPYTVSKVIITSLYLLLGFNALGWHVVTCMFFAGNITLLFLLLRNVLRHFQYKEAERISAIVSLLFLLVPYHTEAVVWAGAFNYLIVTLFVLAALFFCERWLNTGKTIYATLLTLSLLLAVFSHEWGLFGIVATTLLVLLLVPISDLISKKTILPALSAIGVVVVYLFNQWLSNELIAHYGAEVHLNFQWREITAAYFKYISKILLFSGFWEYELQEKLFRFFLLPAANTALFILVLASWIWALWRIVFAKQKDAVGWWLYLCFALFVFPVLNLYFPNWTKIMADRYCYLTSAFLLASVLVFLSSRKWLWRVSAIVYALSAAFFLYQNIVSWQNAGSLISSLQKEFRWKKEERIYFLNMPDNFDGAYMLRSTFTSGVAASRFKVGEYYPRENNMTDVAAYNLFHLSDSAIVEIVDSNSLRVRLSNSNAWWWRNGMGCEDYENDLLKLELNKGEQSYLVKFKSKAKGDVYVYHALGKWKEVPNF